MKPTLLAPALLLSLFGCASAGVQVIHVVDSATGRGIPLVRLELTDNQIFWTDSNGIVAFSDPSLMGQRVWFGVSSPGYQCPSQFMNTPGIAVDTHPGGSATLKLTRDNIAQRLYRMTGVGIYQDSVLAGLPAPIQNPLLNGGVAGQDSVQCLEYQNKLYWFWGDTGRIGGPLGNFSMSGAVSDLPAKGGLDPSLGVNLHYFTDPHDFCKPMIDDSGKGPKWASGMMVVNDHQGQPKLLCEYARVSGLAPPLARSLALWNDQRQIFEKFKSLDLNDPLYPDGQPFRVAAGGSDYFYFPLPYPLTRVRADWDHVTDIHEYEAYTCLKPGTRYAQTQTQLDRDSQGHLIWSWKRDTAPLRELEERDLIKAGLMKPSESWYQLKDIETNKHIMAHGGSVEWNPYRHKWIMIFTQFFGGPSLVGEVWFTEADHPEGPYKFARKIATHPGKDFYNPIQHPMFDQQGGRIIYFEGTYTNTFSGNTDPTPRYNYNQLMYSLDLADPRLKLEPK
ncbi:MAG TPA: hypothetical protein VFE58_06350 [Tepidisphaeraceae bacterium]|jgi:hypothetical protein|nr:hypothetical protein [Tepidisphaeraceae bacterium]